MKTCVFPSVKAGAPGSACTAQVRKYFMWDQIFRMINFVIFVLAGCSLALVLQTSGDDFILLLPFGLGFYVFCLGRFSL